MVKSKRSFSFLAFLFALIVFGAHGWGLILALIWGFVWPAIAD